MPDVAIVNSTVTPAPTDYIVPGTQELLLKAVRATIDGTGAATSYLPALQLLDPAGHVMWTAVNTATPIAAGGSADVSWFPGVGAAASSAASSSVNGLKGMGLLSATSTPNVPAFNAVGVAPGGGDLARLTLLEQMPSGTVTGAAFGLVSLGVAPAGTVQLGLATFAAGEVATYVAVTADIAASLTAGALGIRRVSFLTAYTADGATPLWLVLAFTAAWGVEPFFTGINTEATTTLVDTGFFRPRYLSLAAGSGTISAAGTQSTWQASLTGLFWGGVF